MRHSCGLPVALLCALALGCGGDVSPGGPPDPRRAGAAAEGWRDVATVGLRTINGQFLVAEGGGGGAVNADRGGQGPWETFTLEAGGPLEDGRQVHLRTHAGQYLVAEGGGGGELKADREGAGPWETFTLHRLAGGGAIRPGEQVALEAHAGHYVVAEGGGGGAARADRAAIGAWETFTLLFEAGPGPGPGRRLVGRLRIESGAFVDDTGPVLPIFCHFGEALSRYVRDPDRVRRQLDVIAAAGYDGIRFWTTLGGPFWGGREIGPDVTPAYWERLRELLEELKARGLRAVISQGDIGRIPDRRAFAGRLADVMDAVGAAESVAIVEGGNEAWQTGEPDPARLAEFIGWIEARHPAVLYTLSSPPGETKEELDAWSVGPADLFDVHGYRGGHYWDKIRHIFSIAYEGRPEKRLGWQGEPTGPGAAVSVTENKHELDDDTLAAMAAMSLLARQAWCYMSGPGVLFDSPIEDQPGFFTVPRVRDALPADVMRFGQLIHGGDRWAGERVFAARGDSRCDHALSGDGRFVTIAYGQAIDCEQVRPATIERTTELGGKARIIVGRR